MEITKNCSTCQLAKNLVDFPPKRTVCKECVRIKDRQRYQIRRETILAQKKQQYVQNVQAFKEKNKKYHEENKDKILARKKIYYEENKEKIIEDFRNKYNNDDEFRIKHCIRRRTREFFKDKLKYEEMIGCSPDFLRRWFEYNFSLDEEMGMNWGNFGEWQIDHVYPLSLVAKLPVEERAKYYRWENLRPISQNYNATKHNKLCADDIQLIQNRANEFKNLNQL